MGHTDILSAQSLKRSFFQFVLKIVDDTDAFCD